MAVLFQLHAKADIVEPTVLFLQGEYRFPAIQMNSSEPAVIVLGSVAGFRHSFPLLQMCTFRINKLSQ